MSYQPAVAADRPRRPGAVTVAGLMLYLFLAMALILAIAQFAVVNTMVDAIRDAYRSQNASAEDVDLAATGARVVGYVVPVITLLGGLLMGILGALDLRGRNVARILTWIFGGIGVLCCGLSALSSAASGSVGMGGGNADGIDTGKVQEQVAEAYPGWYGPLGVVTTVIALLALIIALILLALPASNAYFKPAPQQWQPPAGYGDPAYPPINLPPAPGPGDQPPGPGGWQGNPPGGGGSPPR